jgi:hypothetical protein
MAERRSAIFWVLCPKQSLHCYSNSKIVNLILGFIRAPADKLAQKTDFCLKEYRQSFELILFALIVVHWTVKEG